MHNPSQVRSFFEKMSSSISSSQTPNQTPPLEMLHSTHQSKANYVTNTLQDLLVAGQQRTSLTQWEIHDFGVGLPPLAEC